MNELQESNEPREELSLSKAALYLLEECRMVLPGIQALFGFQLIVVFNPSFAQKLNPMEQRLHLVAIGLTPVAVAIIMIPAAYHRQAGSREVTQRFIHFSTCLLLWSMSVERSSVLHLKWSLMETRVTSVERDQRKEYECSLS